MRSSSIGRQPRDSRAQSCFVGVRPWGNDASIAVICSRSRPTDCANADERHAAKHLTGIPTLPARRALRVQQPFALVETQRRGRKACASGDLTDREQLVDHRLIVLEISLDLK